MRGAVPIQEVTGMGQSRPTSATSLLIVGPDELERTRSPDLLMVGFTNVLVMSL